MAEPIWVRRDVVLAVHNEQCAEHGGIGGIRDEGLLDSALARPQHLYIYEPVDVPRLAASYGYGIVCNHAFLDGNKRTAFVIALLFLHLNGRKFSVPYVESVTTMRRIASGDLTEAAFADWLRTNSQPQ